MIDIHEIKPGDALLMVLRQDLPHEEITRIQSILSNAFDGRNLKTPMVVVAGMERAFILRGDKND